MEAFDLNKVIKNALVRVIIPSDRSVLQLINRMVEFVLVEGPAFEAMIMSKEINNPQFRFLFDNQSPAHGYYRWRLYSLMHGDSTSNWRTTPFRMFKNGSFWRPPPVNRYTQGTPDETYEKAKRELETKSKGNLANDKKSKLEEILKNITLERKSISEAMIFCIDNAEKAEEIVESLVESIIKPDQTLNKRISFLYLISDILHNCSVKVANASYYRKGFEQYLPRVFENLNKIYNEIDGKMKSESFKQKILNCVRAWEDWAMYPNEYLINLQNVFIGLFGQSKTAFMKETKNSSLQQKEDEDLDGKPLVDYCENEEDLDGKPLDHEEEDDEHISGSTKNSSTKFVSSKWQTVDPDKLEKQAVTTSKWDFFDDGSDQETKTSKNGNKANLTSYDTDEDDQETNESLTKQKDNVAQNLEDDDDDDDIDGKPMDDDDD